MSHNFVDKRSCKDEDKGSSKSSQDQGENEEAPVQVKRPSLFKIQHEEKMAKKAKKNQLSKN
jgi:hypothetical protein